MGNPPLNTLEQAVSLCEEAIRAAGLEVGKDVMLGITVHSNFFYNQDKGYELSEGVFKSAEEFTDWWTDLLISHPAITYVEDPFHDKDSIFWKSITERYGSRVTIAGAELMLSNGHAVL